MGETPKCKYSQCNNLVTHYRGDVRNRWNTFCSFTCQGLYRHREDPKGNFYIVPKERSKCRYESCGKDVLRIDHAFCSREHWILYKSRFITSPHKCRNPYCNNLTNRGSGLWYETCSRTCAMIYEWSRPDTNLKAGGTYYSQWHNSPKVGYVWARSSWEVVAYKKLDDDKDVYYYKPEPFVVKYELDGKGHNYRPDVLIKYLDRRTHLVEIKPKKYIKDPKNLAKFKYAVRYAKDHKMTFKLWTEKHITEFARSLNLQEFSWTRNLNQKTIQLSLGF